MYEPEQRKRQEGEEFRRRIQNVVSRIVQAYLFANSGVGGRRHAGGGCCGRCCCFPRVGPEAYGVTPAARVPERTGFR